MLELPIHRLFQGIETAVGWLRRIARRIQAPGVPGRSSEERLVPFGERVWATDLPLSAQLMSSIQHAKRNKFGEDVPPVNWKGVQLSKGPFEIAVYPMLLQELQPKTIIEIGAYRGASALWLADQADCLGIDLHIYSLDALLENVVAEHPKVTFLEADCFDLDTFPAELFRDLPHPWLVTEDAHANIYEVLKWLDSFIEPGDYLICEDTISRAYYLPFRRFATEHSGRYRVDTKYADMFGYNVTWNFNSYLKCIAE